MTKNNFEDEFKKRYPKKYWKRRHFHRTHWYEPFYDEDVDFNTNAKSYYDYLARFNGFLRTIVDFINRLMGRNIKTEDTPSINFNKKGDWIDNGSCDPSYDDVITLNANVKISKQTETITFKNLGTFTLNNGSKIKSDGVWSADYGHVLRKMDDDIGNIQNGLQKIVDNLYNSGAITNNNINNFEFNKGRNIATGNINFFGGTADGNSFIRTNKGKTENDVTAGI